MSSEESNSRDAASVRDLLLNTPAGRIVTFGIIIGVASLGYAVCDTYLRRSGQVEQRQVIGNEIPEIFIEINNARYYSHVDGKEISDLVKPKQYVKPEEYPWVLK